MTVGGPNFNNNFGDYGLGSVKGKPTTNKPTDVNTPDIDTSRGKAAALKAGLEGSGGLGKVDSNLLVATAGAVNKPARVEAEETISKTPAAALGEVFDDPTVLFGLESTISADNFEIFAVNSGLTNWGNNSSARALEADDLLGLNNETNEINELLVANS